MDSRRPPCHNRSRVETFDDTTIGRRTLTVQERKLDRKQGAPDRAMEDGTGTGEDVHD